MAGPRVAVVGAGAWGTTLARVVARVEPVTLLCHSPETAARIRDDRAQRGATAGRRPAARPSSRPPTRPRCGTRPTSSSSRRRRRTCARPSTGVAPFLAPEADLLSVVKGLERGTLLRMSEVIAEAAGIADRRGSRRCRARTSPPRSRATCPRRRSSRPRTSSSPSASSARLARRRFRLYVNEDILGVELCGALKNVVAIAAGAADGLGFGDNGKAGLLTRGLAEMTRLGIAAGANPLTFAGPGRDGRPDRHLRLAPVAQPPTRRGAGEGPDLGRDRGDAARDGRGRLHGPGCPGARRAATASRCRSPARSSARCSRARASSAAWSTCWPANPRTSWPTTADGWRA